LDGARVATRAAARPADYIRRVDATGVGFAERDVLSAVEAAEERLLMGLRIIEGVAFADVAALGLTPPNVRDLVAAGLVVDDPVRLRATPAGRRVLNALTTHLATAVAASAA
jgi:oxygen-independent coproporphyrinogen-3 oxidase